LGAQSDSTSLASGTNLMVRRGGLELSYPGFLIPTGQAEPVRSGTGLPVPFIWKPVETGETQISNSNPSSIGFHRYTDRYDRYTGPVRLEPVV
jgi:hypothetical protein